MPKKRKSAPRRPTKPRVLRAAAGRRGRRPAGAARRRTPTHAAATAEPRALVEPELGALLRALVVRIRRRFQPDVVVGIARGGIHVGEPLAAALRAEFIPLRLPRRSRAGQTAASSSAPLPELPDLHDRKVLVVDDSAESGATLARARALSRKSGSRDVRTAVLVERRRGDARPDFAALRTDEAIAFAWDHPAALVDPGEAGA